jgi:hypothetical protein
MHALSRRPTKHEIPSRQEDDAKKSRDKTMFRGPETVFLDIWNEILELVDQEAGNSN